MAPVVQTLDGAIQRIVMEKLITLTTGDLSGPGCSNVG